MRQKLVENLIGELKDSLGPMRPPIEEEALQEAYDSKNYHEMVRLIKTHCRIGLRLRLGLVNHGSGNIPAWVARPKHLPFTGTPEYQQTQVDLYLRKSFLSRCDFEQVVLAISHEMSHLVLDSLRHKLRHTEEAVDLTAMMLGFRDFYVTGCKQIFGLSSGEERVVRSLGYLTLEEVNHAARYMTFLR